MLDARYWMLVIFIQHRATSIQHPTMLLYIIRHAWAYEHGDPRWPDDSKRPLEADGVKRFRRVAKHLVKVGFNPDLIATSPYVRCRQTADIASEEAPNLAKVTELQALTPGSDLKELVAWSQQQDVEELCWVGHSPDVERLAASLISHNASANVRFAKGSVAAIKFDDEVESAAGELQWLVTAKVLSV
jgi:phosphohistidine phosphatase